MNFRKIYYSFSRKNYYTNPSFEKNEFYKFFRKNTFFVRSLFLYLRTKFLKLYKFILFAFKFGFIFSSNTKEFVISKLIWSRGKLGKPIADFSVLIVAFLVFLIGGVFSSSRLVNSASADPDIFRNTTDYLPKFETTLTLIPEDRKRNESIKYIVESGDTLFSIGNKFKISVDAIRYVNNLGSSDTIRVGEELTIPPLSGIIHKVKSGESLASISRLYDVPSQAIADFNYLTDLNRLAVGSELVIPDPKIPTTSLSRNVVSNTTITQEPISVPGTRKGWCVWPTSARIVTQGYFWYHTGVDIATPWFSAMPPIYACADGKVIRAGWDPTGYGIMALIDHGNGYQTLYAHLSSLRVSVGQTVRKGTTIGIMGSTGRSTGPHLHFEVRSGGTRFNPFNFVNY
jgi:murein DD-endopeptidase MepM/ murein hydrolase activator NlpD